MLVGCSNLARLDDAGVSLRLRAEVTWRCAQDAHLALLQNVVDEIKWAEERRPNIVSVFLGASDMDTTDVNCRTLAAAYAYEYNKLVSMGCSVIIMRGWPRPGAQIGAVDYWTNTEWFERELKERLRPECRLWAWDKSMSFNSNFFEQDGIHICAGRYRKMARYLVSPILSAAKLLGE